MRLLSAVAGNARLLTELICWGYEQSIEAAEDYVGHHAGAEADRDPAGASDRDPAGATGKDNERGGKEESRTYEKSVIF